MTVERFGSNTVAENHIGAAIDEAFDLRPAAVIRDLDLRRPIFGATASYGHFGRDATTFGWENTECAEKLRQTALV